MYHILGNMYNKDESNWVIVITSFKLDGYQYIKKTDIIDDVVVYQYNIKTDLAFYIILFFFS